MHGSCAHCRRGLSSRLNLQLLHEYMAPWVWRATHTCELWGGKTILRDTPACVHVRYVEYTPPRINRKSLLQSTSSTVHVARAC